MKTFGCINTVLRTNIWPCLFQKRMGAENQVSIQIWKFKMEKKTVKVVVGNNKNRAEINKIL